MIPHSEPAWSNRYTNSPPVYVISQRSVVVHKSVPALLRLPHRSAPVVVSTKLPAVFCAVGIHTSVLSCEAQYTVRCDGMFVEWRENSPLQSKPPSNTRNRSGVTITDVAPVGSAASPVIMVATEAVSPVHTKGPTELPQSLGSWACAIR